MPDLASSAAYTWQAQSLISTGSVISQVLDSQRLERAVTRAGGLATYNLALVNLYNQDYPDYGYPEATLSVRSADWASTRRTYLIAKRMLIQTLASWQARAGAPPDHRIAIKIADNSGPVTQARSRRRALGGLLLLGLVAAGTCWSLTGRRVR